MSIDQVLAWRMARQYLEPPGAEGAVEVTRRLCGVQAQVASAAALAVRVRLATPPPDAVDRALAERRLIKSWAMRGTLHLLPVDIAGAFLALIAAVRRWEQAAWQNTFVSASQVARLGEAAVELLEGQVLSREDLLARVLERTGDAQLAGHIRSGWGAVLKPLAWQGLLCYGPSEGNRVTFTSPSTWAPGWRGLPSVEQAARVVIPAYLGAYGPATMAAFDSWLLRGQSGRAAVRAWFAAAHERLVEVQVDGQTAFARAEDVDELAAARPSSTVRLLPGFDQYILGPGTGDTRVIPAAHRPNVSRTAGWISPVVVFGGRVVGTWEARGGNLELRLFPESPRPPADVLEAEAARMTALLANQPPDLPGPS